MSTVPSTDELLSHLKRCKDCDYYVGAPVMCKGKGDPSKKGYWFEKCLKNAEPTPNTCKGYTWLATRPRGKPTGGKKPCPGYLCRKANKPGSCNHECTFGVCVQCCRHLQPLLTIVRSCSLADHREGVVYPDPDPDASAGRNEEAPAHSRGRGRPKKNVSKKKRSAATDVEPGTASLSVLPEAPRPPAKVKSYATPVGPLYEARMSSIDAEKRLAEDLLAERAKQDCASARQHSVSLRWWTKDGEDPDFVDAPIDNPSAFHPKDTPLLVADYLCETDRFQYYDAKKRQWYNGSKLSAPRDIKKLSDDDLCYRSFGVTWGMGMPGPNKKRPAPEESTGEDTPRRRIPPFASGPTTPTVASARFESSPGTEPPMSGSTAFPDDTNTDPFADAFDFDFTPYSRPTDPSSFSAINETQPPLAALFPTDLDVASTSTAATHYTPTPTPIKPLVKLDLSSAPRGRGAFPWPWRYVCDMAAGFDAIRHLEDGPQAMTRAQAFREVFQSDFHRTTYGDQFRAWCAAGLVRGERDRWIQYGRTEDGEWLRFMQTWRQHRR